MNNCSQRLLDKHLVLQSKMQMRQHVQARTEKFDTARHYREFALSCFSRISDDADDIATPNFSRIYDELFLALVSFCIRHHLDLDAFAAQVVEYELGTGLAYRVDPPGDAVDYGRYFAILQALAELFDKVLQRHGHMELVRIGMVISSFELLNGQRTKFDVFLYKNIDIIFLKNSLLLRTTLSL